MKILLTALLTLLSYNASSDDYTDYAAQCEAAIGSIPDFSCAHGVTVPITVDGIEPEKYFKNMTCDKPALLPNGADGESNDGQCVPWSKIVNLSSDTAQISVMCRQKHIRPQSSSLYDEIDVIAHNPTSGATCWFQAKGSVNNPLNGEQVPSPTGPRGRQFYKPPHEVANDGCGNCHDNDPFMFSPFVGQIWEHVPVNPFGPYYHVDTGNLGFAKWPTTQIQPRDSTCLGCHRIGINETCGQSTQWATGITTPPGANKNTRSYPQNQYMPPYHGQSPETWKIINSHSVQEIMSCCGSNHDNPMCNAAEIYHYKK